MTTYAIGDIQGCFFTLQHLLSVVDFSPSRDKLWLCGDIVNRGNHSLKTCLYLMSLGNSLITVLGNHDLTLLGTACNELPMHPQHTFQDILESKHKEAIVAWLRQQPLFYVEEKSILVHAGLYPFWSVPQAQMLAQEVCDTLKTADYALFLRHLFGNTPAHWDNALSGVERLRFIVNACTRMRYCHPNGDLNLAVKGPASIQADGSLPWFDIPNDHRKGYTLFFGHWASLQGHCAVPGIRALDTGCAWGRWLTSENIETRERSQVPALSVDLPVLKK